MYILTRTGSTIINQKLVDSMFAPGAVAIQKWNFPLFWSQTWRWNGPWTGFIQCFWDMCKVWVQGWRAVMLPYIRHVLYTLHCPCTIIHSAAPPKAYTHCWLVHKHNFQLETAPLRRGRGKLGDMQELCMSYIVLFVKRTFDPCDPNWPRWSFILIIFVEGI